MTSICRWAKHGRGEIRAWEDPSRECVLSMLVGGGFCICKASSMGIVVGEKEFTNVV